MSPSANQIEPSAIGDEATVNFAGIRCLRVVECSESVTRSSITSLLEDMSRCSTTDRDSTGRAGGHQLTFIPVKLVNDIVVVGKDKEMISII